MRVAILLLSLLSLTWGFQAFAEDCIGTSCLPKEIKESCTSSQTNGCIDWENGVIYATGMGVPNPNFKMPAQKRYSAYEAAKVVALRNLLQMVEDIHITSDQTVKAGMLENDVISTQISGTIRQVMEATKPKTMSDGSVWVTMKMYMKDIMSILVSNENMPVGDLASKAPAPAKAEVTEKKSGEPQVGVKEGEVYTGLIIDARASKVTPAMSPKVYDPKGKEIYGSVAIEREFALQFGVAGYAKDLEKALKNDRVGKNPLIIKGEAAKGRSADLVIGQTEAEYLEKAYGELAFLREARVMILIQ